jgi:hypothetical protein
LCRAGIGDLQHGVAVGANAYADTAADGVHFSAFVNRFVTDRTERF